MYSSKLNEVQNESAQDSQANSTKGNNDAIIDSDNLEQTHRDSINSSDCSLISANTMKQSYKQTEQVNTKSNSSTSSIISKAIAACAHKWKDSLVLPPQKAVALYGPHTLLPPLPRSVHDKVSYAAALDHCELLTRLLQPYGFQVGLVGWLRCGAPHAMQVQVCVSLTAQATLQCLSILHEDGLATNELIHQQKEEEANWTRAFYGAAESVTEQMQPMSWWSSRCYQNQKAPLAQKERKHLQGNKQQSSQSSSSSFCSSFSSLNESSYHSRSLLSSLPKQHCPTACANALHVSIPAQILHRYRRAVDELIRSGYVIAGNYPFPHYLPFFRPFRSVLQTHTSIHSLGKYGFGDEGKVFSVRYDPDEPISTLPFHITNVQVLRRMQLHRLVLYFTPWKCFHTRRLFLTGPSAFTRHVIMQALNHGIEINKNGVFVSRCQNNNNNNVRKKRCKDNNSTCNNNNNNNCNKHDNSSNQVVKKIRQKSQIEQQKQLQKQSTSVEACVKNTQPLLRRAFQFVPLQNYKSDSNASVANMATQADATSESKTIQKQKSNTNQLKQTVQSSSLPSSSYWLQRTRLLIQSEKDIFTLAGMPYVDPLNRTIYCQVHNLFAVKDSNSNGSKNKV